MMTNNNNGKSDGETIKQKNCGRECARIKHQIPEGRMCSEANGSMITRENFFKFAAQKKSREKRQ